MMLACPNCDHVHDQKVCPECGYTDPARESTDEDQ